MEMFIGLLCIPVVIAALIIAAVRGDDGPLSAIDWLLSIGDSIIEKFEGR